MFAVGIGRALRGDGCGQGRLRLLQDLTAAAATAACSCTFITIACSLQHTYEHAPTSSRVAPCMLNPMPSCRCLALEVASLRPGRWSVRCPSTSSTPSPSAAAASAASYPPTNAQTLLTHDMPGKTCEWMSLWMVTVRLPGRPLWCRASQPNTRSWQRRTKGPNSKTPAFFGSARRPRASHSSALTDSVRPPPADETGLDE